MSRQIQIRRGTTAENNAFTGAEGEVTFDTTTHELRVHDGSTQGGFIIGKKSDLYTKTETNTLLSEKANTSLSNITADGKEVIAHNTMPSDRYITLTLGASGSTYTAPADGWIYWNGDFATTSGHIRINSSKIGSATQANAVTATKLARIFIPVSKDDSVTVAYNDVRNTYTFNFIYSQGAQ